MVNPPPLVSVNPLPKAPPKDLWLAVNFSMFYPGLGQVYAGEWQKALLWFSSYSLSVGTGLWAIFSATGDVATGLIFLGIAFALYWLNLVDALLSVFHQNPSFYQEKIPRRWKNPWFAVFATRVLPGLGHFYYQQFVLGLVILTLAILSFRLQYRYTPLLVFGPILSAIALYHLYRSALSKQRVSSRLIYGLIFLILLIGLTFNFFPKWLSQRIDIFFVPSASMSPTVIKGDYIFVALNPDYTPQRQEIIVFKTPDKVRTKAPLSADFFVKRVIGLPGESIRIDQGQVWINDQPLAENYLAETPDYTLPSQVIPADHYFVLGDNRNDSFDSQEWGPLPKSAIVGQAYKIYWPLDRVRSLLPAD